ncbi:hypothetical protein SAMN05421810_10529 [Amycolatopsis arida]|uniref:Uncharacterized protein n=1 Tax=Amycolatopsis arida TaxID=587909 RepID=A0A1I5WCQ5_9PSEU|nr:hypothetical protein [Amycolatopsis arida]TDX92203.1 hypothetical protein CLV69_10548 [Amycolatopsis arida]SFQ17106.1 hypothetical protein SAMN05421810_10529 [Amycolatopsis arida]
MRSRLRAALLVVLVVLLAGCGSGGGGASLNYDPEFAQRLRDLRVRGETTPLKEIVPGQWDTVRIFIGLHTEEWVERELGQQVLERVWWAAGRSARYPAKISSLSRADASVHL